MEGIASVSLKIKIKRKFWFLVNYPFSNSSHLIVVTLITVLDDFWNCAKRIRFSKASQTIGGLTQSKVFSQNPNSRNHVFKVQGLIQSYESKTFHCLLDNYVIEFMTYYYFITYNLSKKLFFKM